MAAGSRLITQAAASLIVALALVTAVEELPDSLREVELRVAENAGVSPLDRDVAAARAFGLNPALILRADEVMPPDAVFYVARGEGQSTALDAATPFASYWLLPRRHTDDPRRADWILSFGADPAGLGVDVEVVESDVGEPGWQLLRVRR